MIPLSYLSGKYMTTASSQKYLPPLKVTNEHIISHLQVTSVTVTGFGFTQNYTLDYFLAGSSSKPDIHNVFVSFKGAGRRILLLSDAARLAISPCFQSLC